MNLDSITGISDIIFNTTTLISLGSILTCIIIIARMSYREICKLHDRVDELDKKHG